MFLGKFNPQINSRDKLGLYVFTFDFKKIHLMNHMVCNFRQVSLLKKLTFIRDLRWLGKLVVRHKTTLSFEAMEGLSHSLHKKGLMNFRHFIHLEKEILGLQINVVCYQFCSTASDQNPW